VLGLGLGRGYAIGTYRIFQNPHTILLMHVITSKS